MPSFSSFKNRIVKDAAEKYVARETAAGRTVTDALVQSADLLPVDLETVPEVLTIAVDAPDAGGGHDWKWSWKAGQVAYTRTSINQITQPSIPLYNEGTYTVYNFAAHELHGNMTQTHKIYLKWIEGPGTDNLVPWSTSTLNVENISFDGVNGGNATEVQRLVINVPETFSTPRLNNPDVSYGVQFDSAGSYTFTGNTSGDNPNIGPFYRGGTYTFNLDSSLSGHPFYITTDDGTNYSSGSYVGEYLHGVTGSRNESGTLQFVVPDSAPDTMYYQCGVHSPMRGSITIKDLAIEYNDDSNPVLYFQHDQDGHKTPAEIRDKPAITSQLTLVYDATTSKFKPQDIGEYLDNTVQFQEKVEDLIEDKTIELGYTTLTEVKNDVVYNITLSQQDELSVITGTARWYAPFDLSITDIRPRLGTAADANIGINIKVDGINKKTTSITAGQTTKTVSNPTFTMSQGSYLTVDITSVGTTAVGENLFIQFTYKKV